LNDASASSFLLRRKRPILILGDQEKQKQGLVGAPARERWARYCSVHPLVGVRRAVLVSAFLFLRQAGGVHHGQRRALIELYKALRPVAKNADKQADKLHAVLLKIKALLPDYTFQGDRPLKRIPKKS